RAESTFNPRARSPANARGLMQVLPSTGAAVARRLGLPWGGAESLYDPATNITLGTAYLREKEQMYGKPYVAIAAYNAGPTPTSRWLSQRGDMDPDIWIETISYRETREYVARILAFSVLYDWRMFGTARPVSERMLGAAAGNGKRKRFECPAPDAAPQADWDGATLRWAGTSPQRRPPPPLAGEGWGAGRIRSPRSTVSRRTLPPSQPSPASGGRSRCAARRIRPGPLPRLRGRAGVGAASARRAQRFRVGHCPHPNLPPQAGEGAGSRREGTGHAPSPACGGGLGWGPHQIAALNGLASDTAPIPTFPRKRGKGPGHGEKIQTAPPPPLAAEGRGGGRFRSPRSTVSRRTLPPSRPSPASGGRSWGVEAS